MIARENCRSEGSIDLFLKQKVYLKFSSTYSTVHRDDFESHEEYLEKSAEYLEDRKHLEGEPVTPELLEMFGDDYEFWDGVVDKMSEEIILKYKRMGEDTGYDVLNEWNWYMDSYFIGIDLKNVFTIQTENETPSSRIILKEYVANTNTPNQIPEFRLKLVVEGFKVEIVNSGYWHNFISDLWGINYHRYDDYDDFDKLLLPFDINDEEWEPCHGCEYCDEGCSCDPFIDHCIDSAIETLELKQGISTTLLPVLNELGCSLPIVLQQHILSYLNVEDMLPIVSSFVEDCKPLKELFLGKDDGQYFIHCSDNSQHRTKCEVYKKII